MRPWPDDPLFPAWRPPANGSGRGGTGVVPAGPGNAMHGDGGTARKDGRRVPFVDSNMENDS